MPIDPERALAAALLAAVRADPGVNALVAGRAWDQPPPDPVYPYVQLGRIEVQPAGSGEPEEGVDMVASLTCVSRFGGKEEAAAVGAALREALHDAALPVADQRLVNLRVSFQDVFRASDWRSVYGVTRLRAVLEPVAAAPEAPLAEAA